jgi:predicted DCC family thiol-disulfide oxidoreductase YuxK
MGQAVLIYDGDCSMCRAGALWLMRRALSRGQLEILPCRSGVRITRFPNISEEACLTAMQLVLPDGRVLAGADAVPELLRRVRGWGWVAAVFSLPGVRPIARRVYAWIAQNRMRISCAVARESGAGGPRNGPPDPPVARGAPAKP